MANHKLSTYFINPGLRVKTETNYCASNIHLDCLTKSVKKSSDYKSVDITENKDFVESVFNEIDTGTSILDDNFNLKNYTNIKESKSNSDSINNLVRNETGKLQRKRLVSNLPKKRLGSIYKHKLAEKKKGRKSEYFKNIVCHERNNHWIPPRSPYCLIQEDLYHNPWQLLIATIFLTKTQAKKAIPQILKFFEKWPTPQSLLLAKQEEIVHLLTPLGIQYVRSELIRRFTVEFLEKDWKYPEELHGIGKYGNDSYRMFCIGEWKSVTPDDNKLNLYKNWLTENETKLVL